MVLKGKYRCWFFVDAFAFLTSPATPKLFNFWQTKVEIVFKEFLMSVLWSKKNSKTLSFFSDKSWT
jgi:hypothetical protein